MNKLKLYGVLSLLTFASLYVLERGMNNDPVYVFRWNECLEQVGFGSALITAWTLYGIRLVRGLLTRRLNGLWALGVLWCAVVVFYLGSAVQGYVSDVRYFRAHTPWGAPVPPLPK